jgi:hexokinase
MYMGEIVRLVVVDFTNQKKLFNGQLSEQMKTKNAFCTSYISDIER